MVSSCLFQGCLSTYCEKSSVDNCKGIMSGTGASKMPCAYIPHGKNIEKLNTRIITLFSLPLKLKALISI